MHKPFWQSLTLNLFYKAICKAYLKIFVGVAYNNTHHLKPESQFIIIANHNSHLDTLCLMSAVPGNILWKVKPVAAKDYFGKTPFRASASNYVLNTLLIDRKGTADRENPIDRMVQELDAGYSLIIFPEGTRGAADKMEKLKSGIAHILLSRPHIKYIPAYLTGMGKSLPKGKFMVLPYKSSVNFGPGTQINGDDKASVMQQITQSFEEMRELYEPKYQDEED